VEHATETVAAAILPAGGVREAPQPQLLRTRLPLRRPLRIRSLRRRCQPHGAILKLASTWDCSQVDRKAATVRCVLEDWQGMYQGQSELVIDARWDPTDDVCG
jgi:hypothetical protein